MKFPRVVIASLLLAAALRLQPQIEAQTDGTNTAPGVAVGAKAPNFTLPGQDGKEHSLDDLLKKGKVALVFFRSADW